MRFKDSKFQRGKKQNHYKKHTIKLQCHNFAYVHNIHMYLRLVVYHIHTHEVPSPKKGESATYLFNLGHSDLVSWYNHWFIGPFIQYFQEESVSMEKNFLSQFKKKYDGIAFLMRLSYIHIHI